MAIQIKRDQWGTYAVDDGLGSAVESMQVLARVRHLDGIIAKLDAVSTPALPVINMDDAIEFASMSCDVCSSFGPACCKAHRCRR